MRTHYLGLVLAGLLACADHPIGPVAAVPQAPVLSAEPSTIITKFPFSSSSYNECVPEWVELSGTISAVSHITQRDGEYVLVSRQQVSIAGIGLTTGDRYRVNSQNTEIINQMSFDGTPYEYHLIQTARLIRESGRESYMLHNVLQVTVTATGEVSVLLELSSITCT